MISRALQVHPGKLFPESEIDENIERVIAWFRKYKDQKLESLFKDFLI